MGSLHEASRKLAGTYCCAPKKTKKRSKHASGGAIKRSKHSVGDVVDKAGSLIGEAAKPYLDKAKRAAFTVNTLSTTLGLKRFGKPISKAVNDVADKYGKKISDGAQNLAGKASGLANDLASKVTGKGADLARSVADTVSSTARGAANKVTGLARGADEAVHKALPGFYSTKLFSGWKANKPAAAAFRKGGNICKKKNKR